MSSSLTIETYNILFLICCNTFQVNKKKLKEKHKTELEMSYPKQ